MDEGFVPVIDEKELQEGKMKLVRVEGKPVLFIRQAGKIYVIDDRCPHMGCKFSGGTLDGNVVICPCHDWRFDIRTGRFLDAPELGLAVYSVKAEAGKLFVALA